MTTLASTPAYRFCRVAQKVHNRLDELFLAHGTRTEQWAALRTIDECGPLCQKDLAIILGKNQNTIKALIDRLLAQELIERTPNPKDRRQMVLRISKTGSAQLAKLAPQEEAINRSVTDALSEEESETRFYDMLSAAWKPLGVKVTAQRTPVESYLSNIKNWKADVFLYSWIGDFAEPLAFLELFRTESKLRETTWTSKEYDALLDEASGISDTAERYKVFAKAEQLLLDEAVIMPISHPVSFHIIDTKVVGGWYSNALDIHPFKYLYFKEVKVESAPNVI